MLVYWEWWYEVKYYAVKSHTFASIDRKIDALLSPCRPEMATPEDNIFTARQGHSILMSK
jgi:hypothetical protein